jgi:hypothetical protein
LTTQTISCFDLFAAVDCLSINLASLLNYIAFAGF